MDLPPTPRRVQTASILIEKQDALITAGIAYDGMPLLLDIGRKNNAVSVRECLTELLKNNLLNFMLIILCILKKHEIYC